MSADYLLAPSVLSADVLKLKEQVGIVEKNGADWIHVDVMDGHFVPNITFGPFMVRALKNITGLPLDVHLMIESPERYIAEFTTAGADYITVHQEACVHLHRTMQVIKNEGAKAGVTINPATALETIIPALPFADLVLIMSVNPGFGGQQFIPEVVDKIGRLARIKKEKNYSFLIEVDGGINEETGKQVLSAGAEVLVAGNAVFGQSDISAACREMKHIPVG